MNRGKINWIIDLFFFLAISLAVGIGFMIKFILPPGRDRILQTGMNTELLFLGMDRHQWGSIHLATGLVLIVLVVLHVILHWNVILCLFRKAIPRLKIRRLIAAGVLILAAGCLFFPFLFRRQEIAGDDFLHRNLHQKGIGRSGDRSQIPGSENLIQTEHSEGVLEKSGSHEQVGDPSGLDYERHEDVLERAPLQGKMTISHVAELYDISTQEIKERLGVLIDVPDTETMGHLRRKYGFTMEEARKRLKQVQPDPVKSL